MPANRPNILVGTTTTSNIPGNDNADDDGATILDDGLSTCDDVDDHYDENENRRRNNPRILTTSADAARQIAESKRYHRFTCALFIITLLISAIVSSVKIYYLPTTRNYNWNIFGDGKQQREKENALRLNQTLEYLIQTGAVVNSEVTLSEENNNDDIYVSPQYGAAVWIAQYDMLRVPIPSVTTTTTNQNSTIFDNNNNNSSSSSGSSNTSRKSSEEYQFLQRYSLAVLFFATGGIDTWNYKLNFLRGVHECEGWYDLFIIDEDGSDIFPFGVICDGSPEYESTDILEEDVWKGMRTVTAIVLPRKFFWISISASTM